LFKSLILFTCNDKLACSEISFKVGCILSYFFVLSISSFLPFFSPQNIYLGLVEPLHSKKRDIYDSLVYFDNNFISGVFCAPKHEGCNKLKRSTTNLFNLYLAFLPHETYDEMVLYYCVCFHEAIFGFYCKKCYLKY